MPAVVGVAAGAAAGAKGASAGAAGGAAAGGAGAGAKGAGAAGKGLGGQLQKEAAKRAAREAVRNSDRRRIEQATKLLLVFLGLVFAILGLLLLPLLMLQALNPFGGGSNAYPPKSGIPQVYWPIYTAAAGAYKVSPYLLASIHKQETGFSENPSASHGVNAYGCCAGPMQFNVKAGSWKPHAHAFRAIEDVRPGSYPLDRRTLPSCRGVATDEGCVYDDFDAIAGAAHKLKADGADASLYSAGTRKAVCAYIGACSEVDNCTGSQNQYCQVLPRARQWAVSGGSEAAPAAGARALVEHAFAIAHGIDGDIYVCSDYRPGSTTSGGGVSDHASNDAHRAARDIAMRGRDCIAGPPARALDRAAVAIGGYFGRSYRLGTPILADTFVWHGYRIQIIWRTPQWGGHMGHIHVGASKA